MTQQPRTPTQITDPSGQTVAKNIRRIREARGWSTYEVAGRLDSVGRKGISASAVAKVERAQRRVDVGDLIALAVVLGVSPLALLLPPTGQGDAELTGAGTVSARTAWLWALGEEPLDLYKAEDPAERFERAREFRHANQPHAPRVPFGEMLADMEKLAPVWAAARAAQDEGVSMDTIRSYLAFREEAEELKRAREGRGADG